MPRKAHTKSRNGCIVCKRRHVKCDESYPTCSNCRDANRHCEYQVSKAVFRHSSLNNFTRTSTPLQQPSPISPQVITEHDTEDDSYSPVNMHHMNLFHFLTTETLPSLHTHELIDISPTDILKHCLPVPYLMNEFLGFAALHKSIVGGEAHMRESYRFQAMNFQTHALSIYNAEPAVLNAETCIAAFLFSSVLGAHLLCDTLIYRGDDTLNKFLERFVQYIHIHRGIRTVVGGHWDDLSQSPIGRSFVISRAVLGDQPATFGPTLTKLLGLIQSAKLGESLTKSYKLAIGNLQSIMNVCEVSTSTSISTPASVSAYGAVIAWPVMVPIEYVDALGMRRPEALVILAYYAALLHLYQQLWMFGDGGRFLIESICDSLGVEWGDWLEWPMKILHDDNNSLELISDS
ncbi:hypothetical protein TMatcc_009003 [Talaromyces marneffei ATCC 18224]|uniref:Zn(2)-C6 fungal-type domain-containing protein n=2 Tax=Talaromyces marneffei TaxID=37727 RepID=B6QNT7_TALMQ|nr:conserved hypothetical protein [Talaromyces marneffei ATCC 18224]KAE8550936.1 hypothetical protein EYB25_007168 [Talaromyces marneffei]